MRLPLQVLRRLASWEEGMSLHPRHQILPEGDVLVTVSPGVYFRMNPNRASAFAWSLLNDLDPDEADRCQPKTKDAKPRLSPAAQRLLALLIKNAGRTVAWPVAEGLYPHAKAEIVKVHLTEVRKELTRMGYPAAITTYRGEGVMLDKAAAKECGL
jgi:hypothetical protein